MKRIVLAVCITVLLAAGLTGCKVNDLMLYLYGGDDFVQSDAPDYVLCEGKNGVTTVYDANTWQTPSMAQEDTLSLTGGNQLSYTVVLLQTTDSYTDFLTQNGEELNAETNTVQYDFEFTVPSATVNAVRYDCGSYQMIFAQLDYENGQTIYVTSAARTSNYEPIIALLQNVWPTGAAPEDAQKADREIQVIDGDSEAANGAERQESLA